MTLQKSVKKFQWSFQGIPIEQCRSYRFLSLIFSKTLKWNVSLESTKALAFKTVGVMIRFYYTRGSFLIDPILKLFVSKVICHLLYGIKVWRLKEQTFISLETIQNLFMRLILLLPKEKAAAFLLAELNLPLVRKPSACLIVT